MKKSTITTIIISILIIAIAISAILITKNQSEFSILKHSTGYTYLTQADAIADCKLEIIKIQREILERNIAVCIAEGDYDAYREPRTLYRWAIDLKYDVDDGKELFDNIHYLVDISNSLGTCVPDSFLDEFQLGACADNTETDQLIIENAQLRTQVLDLELQVETLTAQLEECQNPPSFWENIGQFFNNLFNI